MRKLYETTGGQPQRWESVGNLGTVKADAAGDAEINCPTPPYLALVLRSSVGFPTPPCRCSNLGLALSSSQRLVALPR
jgi:hypothetical protein